MVETERRTATRDELRALAAAPPEVIFEPEATPAGGLWVRRMTPKELRTARQKARVVGEGDEIQTDLEQLNRLCLAYSLVTGPEPEAPRLYQTSEDDLLALEDEIPEGYRMRLLALTNALMGFPSGEERLAFLRRAGHSTCGVSTASGATPASSPSPNSGSSGKTTAS